ncbi:MAG: PAS domain S-box protein [Bacteroidales bacterium]|nr:PAS domain S-box protein [Bacteroidales bacterium]
MKKDLNKTKEQLSLELSDLRNKSIEREKMQEAANQQLLEYENKSFQAIVDSIDAVVYVADMQTYELLFLNKYGKQNWGDKVGEKCYKALQGLDTPCNFCTNNKLLDKNGNPSEPYVWEFQNTITKQLYQCRDQAITWIDGRLVRLEIAVDITKSKEAEQALKQSEEKYRSLYNQSADPVLIYKNRRFVDCNQAALDILGMKSIEELMNVSATDLSPEFQPDGKKSEEKSQEMDKLALENGNHRFEWIHKKTDGSEFPVEVMLTSIKTEKDQYFYVVWRDITVRKQAEENLKESEIRYKELFDNISSGVAVYDVIDGGKDFIFKDFNKAAERIDNDKRDDLIGKSIFEMRPEVEKFGLIDVFRKVWKTGKPVYHPITFYQDEKIHNWYDNFVYKLQTEEIVAVFNDITERKQAEELLIEREQQLRELNATKDKFF